MPQETGGIAVVGLWHFWEHENQGKAGLRLTIFLVINLKLEQLSRICLPAVNWCHAAGSWVCWGSWDLRCSQVCHSAHKIHLLNFEEKQKVWFGCFQQVDCSVERTIDTGEWQSNWIQAACRCGQGGVLRCAPIWEKGMVTCRLVSCALNVHVSREAVVN